MLKSWTIQNKTGPVPIARAKWLMVKSEGFAITGRPLRIGVGSGIFEFLRKGRSDPFPKTVEELASMPLDAAAMIAPFDQQRVVSRFYC